MQNRQQMAESAAGLMGQVENLPASVYYWGALGSIGLSALLMLLGRKNLSVFVGLWPPTIALLGLFNKQLRPSQDVRQAGNLAGMRGEDARALGQRAREAASNVSGSD